MHRAAFPPEEVAHSIYASHGVHRYLARLVTYPALQVEHLVRGAWHGEQLVGYAHSRALPDSWHLNYIAVLATHRGRGIGQTLWAKWIRLGQDRGHHLLTLDVNAENRRALEWYQANGFVIREKNWTYVRELHRADKCRQPRPAVVLRDWEQAQAWQSAYGFSRFTLAHAGQEWSVGRLGDLFFRVDDRFPAVLETVLVEIDPARRLLISSHHPLDDPLHQRVKLSYRMAKRTGADEKPCQSYGY